MFEALALSNAGGVAALVAALLHDGGIPDGLGPVQCLAVSPAAVFDSALADAVRPYVTSLINR